MCNYELHSYLTGALSLECLLLQISDLDEDSAEFRRILLEHCDPYVTRAANIKAMQYLYPLLRPDFNIGAGNGAVMRENGITSVRMMGAYNTLRFEVCRMVLNAFLQAQKEAELMKSGAAGSTRSRIPERERRDGRMSLCRFYPAPSDRMAIIWSLMPIKDAVVLEYGPAGTTHFGGGLYGSLGLELWKNSSDIYKGCRETATSPHDMPWRIASQR